MVWPRGLRGADRGPAALRDVDLPRAAATGGASVAAAAGVETPTRPEAVSSQEAPDDVQLSPIGAQRVAGGEDGDAADADRGRAPSPGPAAADRGVG